MCGGLRVNWDILLNTENFSRMSLMLLVTHMDDSEPGLAGLEPGFAE